MFSIDKASAKHEMLWISCEDVRLYGKFYIPETFPASALLICHCMNVRGAILLETCTRLVKTVYREDSLLLFLIFKDVGKARANLITVLANNKMLINAH